MAHKVISSALRSLLTPAALALLDVKDATIEALRHDAQNGDTAARSDLLDWAGVTARNYFYLKYQKGEVRSTDEAETMAADFLLEFEHNLPKLQQAARWTRVMLARYIMYTRHREKRHAERSVSTDPQTMAEVETTGAPTDIDRDALVRTIRDAFRAKMDDMGAAHMQYGRFYRYDSVTEKSTVELVRGIKKLTDPGGLLNPGVLGL